MIFDTDVLIWEARGNLRAAKVIQNAPRRQITAATALENDLVLCTSNVKHDRQIPLLSLFPLKVA